MTLDQFLRKLDTYTARIPLSDLTSLLANLQASVENIRDYVCFSRERYRRNLLRAGPAYHALILCWHAGQRSPLHDHRGSTCAVRTMLGVATESQFARTANGMVYPTLSRQIAVGQVCASQDDDIHQMSNLQLADDLITMHVYSPPLLTMRQYSLDDATTGEYADPVFEFSMGAGI